MGIACIKALVCCILFHNKQKVCTFHQLCQYAMFYTWSHHFLFIQPKAKEAEQSDWLLNVIIVRQVDWLANMKPWLCSHLLDHIDSLPFSLILFIPLNGPWVLLFSMSAWDVYSFSIKKCTGYVTMALMIIAPCCGASDL